MVGSLWTIQPFSNHAMLKLMKELWRPVDGMINEILEDNKFLFTFFCRVDTDYVLDQHPWTFDNNVLMLQETSSEQQPRQIVLNSLIFWI